MLDDENRPIDLSEQPYISWNFGMVLGRSVRLYLVDGSPTGILTAEIMNWTGHALVSPRSSLGDAFTRDEVTRTGIYFLVGDDPDQPTKTMVYIGEGDNVLDRIKTHSKDGSKDFWSRVCIVTSKDANLTKSHVRYLEQRLVEITKAADRASLANGNEPARKNLPESDIADMEFFISQIEVILPVVGFDFLRPKGRISLQPAAEISSDKDISLHLELSLASDRLGYAASAIEVGGEITILAGSTATTKDDFAQNTYSWLREQLITEQQLITTPDVRLLKFTRDVTFQSASAAAAVVTNRNTNGRTAWHLAQTGQTLKDWQDAQLEV